MNRLFLALIIFLYPVCSTSAYEPTQTHAGLTEQVVEFYNSKFGNIITSDQKELMIWGAMEEDAPAVRAMNHFYDPVRNMGVESSRTAKEWALGNVEINDYDWNDAIRLYAKGDEYDAYIALGHIVHLIEDMGVPDHTRNDQHLPIWEILGGDSPYEDWAKQNKTRVTLHGLGKDYVNAGYPIKSFDDLAKYFDFLANYSNRNFFSRDTIENTVYVSPTVSKVLGKYAYAKDTLTSKDAKVYIVEEIKGGSRRRMLKTENDTSVLSSYFDRLAPQIITSGAGVVDLFLKEAKKARVAYIEDYRHNGNIAPENQPESSASVGFKEESSNIGEMILFGLGIAKKSQNNSSKNLASAIGAFAKDPLASINTNDNTAIKTFIQQRGHSPVGTLSSTVSEQESFGGAPSMVNNPSFLSARGNGEQSTQSSRAVAISYSPGFGGGAPLAVVPSSDTEPPKNTATFEVVATTTTTSIHEETATTTATTTPAAIFEPEATSTQPISSSASASTTVFTLTEEEVATSTPAVTLGYTVVAEQPDHTTLDTTPVYISGVGVEHNVVLPQEVTFTGTNKGDLGRVVVWYKFGYKQDCSTIGNVILSSNPGTGVMLSSISSTPNWDGSCVFHLNGGPDDSVTMAAGAYALYVYGGATHSPPYVYGKAGEPMNAVYCLGNNIYASSCEYFKGSSTNLSDFGYLITSDTYVPPPVPEGVSSIPETLSPVMAEQTDHSIIDTTPQPSSYIVQHNVFVRDAIVFKGANKGDEGRVVAWYSFGVDQDCSTVGFVALITRPGDGVFLYPISKVPNAEGACVFHLGDPNGEYTLVAGNYALYMAGGMYSIGMPRMVGKAGGNSNAVFCGGASVFATSCEDLTRYSENLSDFAYLVTADAYNTPSPVAAEVSVVPASGTVATSSPAVEDAPVVAAPDPDTIEPIITKYTFNGAEGDIITDFSATTPTVEIVFTASENVDWKSITIEDKNNPDNYRRFLPGKDCDSTTECKESWDGALSPVDKHHSAPDGMYRIKVHIKDSAKNEFSDYLTPHTITVRTAETNL